MYELDFISGRWLPQGWTWNGYEQRAEPPADPVDMEGADHDE